MRKLCLVPALLLAAASASAETPVKLWNDYVYNQPVESVKAEAGIFDCSQRGQQMFCRANVEFAGHKDWGEVFFFTNGRLKAVSLFAPISRAHFTDADKYGIGNCSGFEKENWTYALNGSFCCEHYQQR